MQPEDFLSLAHAPRCVTRFGKIADVLGVSSPKPLWQQETEGASSNLLAAISKDPLGPLVEKDDELFFVNRDNAIWSDRHDAGKKCELGKIIVVHVRKSHRQRSQVSRHTPEIYRGADNVDLFEESWADVLRTAHQFPVPRQQFVPHWVGHSLSLTPSRGASQLLEPRPQSTMPVKAVSMPASTANTYPPKYQDYASARPDNSVVEAQPACRQSRLPWPGLGTSHRSERNLEWSAYWG